MSQALQEDVFPLQRGLERFGAVHAVAGTDFGAESDLSDLFVDWLFENLAAIRAVEWNDMFGSVGAERFRHLYDAVTPQTMSKDQFLDVTRHLPFDQILADLTDFQGQHRHDKDLDLRTYVAEQLQVAAGETVLDVGCSTGRNFLNMPRDIRCVGLDLSLVSLQIGARAWATVDEGPAPTLCAANALEMPIEDTSCDKVQVYGVLGLIPIREALAELKRVMKPGGRVALFIEGLGFWQEHRDQSRLFSKNSIALARWYFGRKLQETGINWKSHPTFGRLSSMVQYTPASLEKCLRDAGLDVVDISVIRTYKEHPRVIGACAQRPDA